ncbi:hypothetical protein [Novosphingobium sp. KN65.2]|uniref:hypothetical protein n=1 Tax=Novosphingobium sp. KN65.2 TaxID=1478134 RepID=UPI0006D558D4|nr:hypothetical protein [Novosphingobium sp. KN65.2]
MFSTKKLSALAGAVLALTAADAALAGTIVVRSSGPSAASYPVGKSLAADAKLTLKPGDVITVLDASGTRVLKGPGQVAVTGSGAATGSGLTALLANTGARQSRTGATRSAIGGGPARSPNVWYVDASRGGTQCLADANLTAIWRPDNATEGSATLTRESDGKSAVVDFRAGQSVRAWPVEELPVAEGARFKIALTGAAQSVTVKVAMVNPANADLDGVASALLAKGCNNQMDVLVEGSKQEAGPGLASN